MTLVVLFIIGAASGSEDDDEPTKLVGESQTTLTLLFGPNDDYHGRSHDHAGADNGGGDYNHQGGSDHGGSGDDTSDDGHTAAKPIANNSPALLIVRISAPRSCRRQPRRRCVRSEHEHHINCCDYDRRMSGHT